MTKDETYSDKSLLKNISLITPLSLLARVGTFLIYVALANWFGDTGEMDFIYYYWGIATFLIELLSAASAYSVLVPLLAEARAKSADEARQCVQSILSRYIMLMPLFSWVLVAFTWWISQLFLQYTTFTTVNSIIIVCGFLSFSIIASVRWMLKAILDTYQAFHLPVIVQGFRAAIVISTIFLCKEYIGWFSIPIALIIGELFQVIILLRRCGVILKLKVRDMFILRKNREETTICHYTKQFFRQCILMMGAAISDGLNPVVDRGMASSLGVSSVSKLDYSLRLCAIPETLTGVTLPILLSHWAKLSSSDNDKKLHQSVWKGVVVVTLFMLPFLICFYILRINIVAILYGHGELSVEGQHHIASLLGVYLIGMLPRLVSRLLIRAHLAQQNHLAVLTATLIRLVLNPLLNWVFMGYWGLEGIAWSTALLSYPILAYIAIEFLRKHYTSEKSSG